MSTRKHGNHTCREILKDVFVYTESMLEVHSDIDQGQERPTSLTSSRMGSLIIEVMTALEAPT